MYKILSIENDSVDGDVFYQTSDPKKNGYKFILEEFYGK